ncbi:N-acetylglucosamine-6-phosphate deacetylase [Pseudocitrobacter corydidari]|uniref:Amidohydrolase-related domain-containing protein n=1 Tax=Pseudocitrobacter corydidari TaxID=2891570 RepID=A0ABY3SAQ8_9ENTR|nr:amidohydrolase family protein [Pseudocitrobacter corydidari]UGS43801.1 hypothetical protein G163CM_45840 [Pseudocitrobacter corydidari]
MTESVIYARDYRHLKPVKVVLEEGVIQSINLCDETDASLPIIAPGFVDLQINGFQGIDFNHYPFSEEQVEHAVRQLWQHGVTSWLPTVITAVPDTIGKSMAVLARACERSQWVGEAIPGFHLEGPFLSPQDGPRGAHPQSEIRPPDTGLFDEWQQLAKGRIRILTLSAEWPETAEFIRRYKNDDVLFSIGHTAATPAQIDEAVEAGASMSTHLGNGAHLQLPRHPNYIWQQLADDRLACTMIADGEHLPISVLKVFIRAKGEQAILVSDVTSFAGLAPGYYHSHIGGEVMLSENGRLSLRDNPQLLAGSARSLLEGVNYLLRSSLVDLRTAIDMASVRPARQLSLPQQGGLTAGAPADFILFQYDPSQGIRLSSCWKKAQKVWGDETQDADRLTELRQPVEFSHERNREGASNPPYQ